MLQQIIAKTRHPRQRRIAQDLVISDQKSERIDALSRLFFPTLCQTKASGIIRKCNKKNRQTHSLIEEMCPTFPSCQTRCSLTSLLAAGSNEKRMSLGDANGPTNCHINIKRTNVYRFLFVSLGAQISALLAALKNREKTENVQKTDRFRRKGC